MEFLLWWRDQRVFPALVTTQPNDGVVPGATVLFGGPVDESARPGGRLEFGLWLDPCQRTAVGARYLAVADASISPEYTSSDLAFIARPFTDVSTNPATATAFSVANAAAQPSTTGRLGLRTDSEIQAGDVFFLWTLRQSSCASFGLLAGYQFAQIDEDLFIESFTQSGGTTAAVQSIAVSDLFDAQNEFHGGMFGLRGDYRCGQFGVELLGRFGFGNMRQSILISGSTTSTDASGATSTRASGLLAQAATNGGLHEQDKFSFMNEAGVKLAFYPVERLKLSVGYSLMYWSSVVRPGFEIDTSIDGRLLTALPPANATQPAFAFDPTDYLVHGLNFGAELRVLRARRHDGRSGVLVIRAGSGRMHGFARHAKKVRDSAAKIGQHALAGDFFLLPSTLGNSRMPCGRQHAFLSIPTPVRLCLNFSIKRNRVGRQASLLVH